MPPKDSKKYYQDNQKERIMYSRFYRRTHRAEIKAYMAIWRKENVSKIRKYYKDTAPFVRDRVYNCSVSEMKKRQKNLCAICKKRKELVVDHDHSCCAGDRSCGKCVRGLLCRLCNYLLGHAKDSPKILRAAVAYLEKL